MYYQFNIHNFYVLPTQFIYVFCVDLRTNSDYFPIHHYVFGFCNRGGVINPLNAKLNPSCHLLALLGAHRILHISRIRVNTVHFPCRYITYTILNTDKFVLNIIQDRQRECVYCAVRIEYFKSD